MPIIREKFYSRKTVFIVSTLIFLALAIKFFDHTVDDAFISFRYAENLVEGHGLVFNPGERVEGYTNFLWVIISAFSISLSINPEIFMRIVGLLASIGTIAAVVRFGPKPNKFPSLVYAAPLLLAANPSFTVWSTGGMETPLFAFFVTWGVLLAAKGIENDKLPLSSAVLLGLSVLTRPEGILVAALVFATALIIRLKNKKLGRDITLWLLVFAAIYLPYFIWRTSYYGFLFPNTFYAKVDTGGSQILRGFAYFHRFMSGISYWLLLCLAGLIWTRKRRFILALGILTTIYVFYVIYIGGDGLPLYRFFVPVLGVFFLLISESIKSWFEKFGNWKPIKAIFTIVLVFTIVYSIVPSYAGPDFNYVKQDHDEVNCWIEIGRWFKDNSKPDDSIAVIPAGAIPYYSGLKTIDMLGLNDLTIGRKKMDDMGKGQAGHEKYNIDYVLSRKPAYVIIGVYSLSPRQRPPEQLIRPFYPAETELLKSPDFNLQYSLQIARTEGGFFFYFARNKD